MVDFKREKEILELLGIECGVDVVIDKEISSDVVYDPAKNRAQIYASGFTDFVEAAGKLKVGLSYHPLFATPLFLNDTDYERRKIAAKLSKYWRPLLAGWGWREVRNAVYGELLDSLKQELRLELDIAAINMMFEGKKKDSIELIRKQVGYFVLGGIFAIRIRASSKKKEELYAKYLETLFDLVEEEPSFSAMERIGRIFFPELRIEPVNDGCGYYFLILFEEKDKGDA